jgi:hypothetical protein
MSDEPTVAFRDGEVNLNFQPDEPELKNMTTEP